MSPSQGRITAARQRMIQAADRRDARGSNEAWQEWQQAAADYWVLKHPELA